MFAGIRRMLLYEKKNISKTRGAQTFQKKKSKSHLKTCGHHCTKFRRPGHLTSGICVPLRKKNSNRKGSSDVTQIWRVRAGRHAVFMASFYPRHTGTALTFTMAFLDNGTACNKSLIGKRSCSIILKTHTQHYIHTYIHTRRFKD